MKLYHGSTVIVDKPLVCYGRDNLDFGKGFYTTSMQSQAEKWVQRFIFLGKKGIINIYNFDDTDNLKKYRYKKFLEYNEEWLDFVLACRGGSKEYQNYDIIEGGIANDKVFNTVELFLKASLINQQHCSALSLKSQIIRFALLIRRLLIIFYSLNLATKQKETMHDSRRYSFADEIRTNNFPSGKKSKH